MDDDNFLHMVGKTAAQLAIRRKKNGVGESWRGGILQARDVQLITRNRLFKRDCATEIDYFNKFLCIFLSSFLIESCKNWSTK